MLPATTKVVERPQLPLERENLTNNQWHTITFLPLNRLCHLYPPHPSLSLTVHPAQRYAAANEAQSGWTTSTQTTQNRGGEGQHFCVKNKRWLTQLFGFS
jgi:hypothetical protein